MMKHTKIFETFFGIVIEISYKITVSNFSAHNNEWEWSYGVFKESHEGLIIIDLLNDYDEAHEAFLNIFWAPNWDILVDRSIDLSAHRTKWEMELWSP